jgi:hypothetical protein
MSLRNWDSEIAKKEMTRLTQPNVLGFYTHFEATEVFAFPPGQREPINVFSLLVAEERLPTASEEPHYLTPKLIELKSLKGWKVGIQRYVKPVAELVPAFDILCQSNKWCASGHPLQTAELVSIPTQFVRSDDFGLVPLNRVLKNNFWNGSHIFEWADANKAALQPLFDDPQPRLQELSEAVRAFVPISLASLSDRLGSIVVQLPITVLITKFAEVRVSGDFTLSTAWHPRATSRPLRAFCAMEYDKAIPAFNSVSVEGPETSLPMRDGQGLHRGVLWDDENHILLAATGDMSFINQIVVNMQVLDPEPREFTLPGGKGDEKPVRFGLSPKPIKISAGEPKSDPAGNWTQRRMYREETDRLLAERRFVQYKPVSGAQLRDEALGHVRDLINRHGEEGVWLWDPFLSADDVINTLFYCRFFGSELRALTAGSTPPTEGPSTRRQPPCFGRLRARLRERFARPKSSLSASARFAAEQRATLTSLKSNLRGIHLEFRIRTGSAGWGFHDRFLIFPTADSAALAWSLGTSVNSLGRQHHILQRVDDGQRIRDAFAELWDALDQPEHLIWKTP